MKKSFYVFLVLIIVACGNGANNEVFENLEPALMEDASMTTRMDQRSTGSVAPSSAQQEIVKKQITTGSIHFKSEDVQKDYEKIKAVLPDHDAYLQNENQSLSQNRIDYSMTVRVPAEKYNGLFNAIISMDILTENKSSNVQDVTERYYDLKTRIENKKALENRYLVLLEKAVSVKDILEIERNLNDVRTEIEQMQGQFNYLSKQIDYSTIYLSFYEELPYEYQSSSRQGFGARILNALDGGWQGFLSFIVFIFGSWPFILIVGATVLLIRRIRSKRKNKSSEGASTSST